MPQSLSNLLVHVAFSTKSRNPYLEPVLRKELFAFLTGYLQKNFQGSLQVGGVEDHIHILFPLPRVVTLADMIKDLKVSSSKWVKENSPRTQHFAWQSGYGAFSVSPQYREVVVTYISGQEDHHRKVSFQDEFRRLLKEAGIEWDERYVWD